MVSAYELIELAKKTGKIEKGTNEVTKAVERKTAKFVAVAEDVQPKEIVQHIPKLCEEYGIPCTVVDSKKKLGASAGIGVSTASVAITDLGDASKHMGEFSIKKKK
jgi:large subunit ribosomal protein L7Ae